MALDLTQFSLYLLCTLLDFLGLLPHPAQSTVPHLCYFGSHQHLRKLLEVASEFLCENFDGKVS